MKSRLGALGLALAMVTAVVGFHPDSAAATHGGAWYSYYAPNTPSTGVAAVMDSASAFMDKGYAHIINSSAGTSQQVNCIGGPPSTCPAVWTSYIAISFGQSGKNGGCAIDGTHTFPTSVEFPGSQCQSWGLFEHTAVWTW